MDHKGRAKNVAAIGRIIAQALVNAVSDALGCAMVQEVGVGDPCSGRRKMGGQENVERRADVKEKVNILLAAGCENRLGGRADLICCGCPLARQPSLYCFQARMKHRRYMQQAFGPVTQR